VTSVGVLDYGSGNLHSACQALAEVGAEVTLSSRWQDLDDLDGLVLPGVGAYATCMAGIGAGPSDGYRPWLDSWLQRGRPLLGICVGHQVLFGQGVEHGVSTAGLGVLPGVVERLPAKRLPHMGWNTVAVPDGSVMFAGVEQQRVYFVHSYAVLTVSPSTGWPGGQGRISWCEHQGVRFLAAVEWGPVWSTQFHPEKSGEAGARLLRNWLGFAESMG